MRTEIYLEGIDPGPLGSYKDRHLRSYLYKKKTIATHKLMAQIAASIGNADIANSAFRKFSSTSIYKDPNEREERMLEIYHREVKGVNPTLHADENGLTVRGLNGQDSNGENDT